MTNAALRRLRYAPEAAIVAATIEVAALLRLSLVAAHQRLLEERPPPSRERRLALALVRDIDALLRDGARYYDYVASLAELQPPVSTPPSEPF